MSSFAATLQLMNSDAKGKVGLKEEATMREAGLTSNDIVYLQEEMRGTTQPQIRAERLAASSDVASIADTVIMIESGGKWNSVNPNSSAVGGGQYLQGTWVELATSSLQDAAKQVGYDNPKDVKTDYTNWIATLKAANDARTDGKRMMNSSEEGLEEFPKLKAFLDLRKDKATTISAVKADVIKQSEMLKKNKLPVTPENIYKIHFLGAHNALAILKAKDSELLTGLGLIDWDISINKNPNITDTMTVADFNAMIRKTVAKVGR